MGAELRALRQCRRCGAVTGDIRTQRCSVHVDSRPVLLYPNRHGRAIGYTLDGRAIQGDVVDKAPGGIGVWEVFLRHQCGAGGDGHAEPAKP